MLPLTRRQTRSRIARAQDLVIESMNQNAALLALLRHHEQEHLEGWRTGLLRHARRAGAERRQQGRRPVRVGGERNRAVPGQPQPGADGQQQPHTEEGSQQGGADNVEDAQFEEVK